MKRSLFWMSRWSWEMNLRIYDSRKVVPDHFQSNTMLLCKVGHDEVPTSGMPPKATEVLTDLCIYACVCLANTIGWYDCNHLIFILTCVSCRRES